MTDPVAAKREARRTYMDRPAEEGSEEDALKLDKQMKPWNAQERNSKGDTWASWMFEQPNTRNLSSQIDMNESDQRLERMKAGDYGTPAPKFANGGMVKHGSSTRVTCRTKHG